MPIQAIVATLVIYLVVCYYMVLKLKQQGYSLGIKLVFSIDFNMEKALMISSFLYLIKESQPNLQFILLNEVCFAPWLGLTIMMAVDDEDSL